MLKAIGILAALVVWEVVSFLWSWRWLLVGVMALALTGGHWMQIGSWFAQFAR